MGRYFRNIWDGIVTVLIGMKVTWRHLFLRSVTIQYPDVKLKLTVDLGLTSVGTKKRLYVPKFDIDIAKCCYCGLCVYPCPTECIKMTDVYEFSEYERQNLVYSFAVMMPAEIDAAKAKLAAHEKEQAAKKAAAAAVAAAAKAAPASPPPPPVAPAAPQSSDKTS
jgi:NADH-quinone oxidoreductase subunit I